MLNAFINTNKQHVEYHFEDPFYLPDDYYYRDLNQIKPYIEDAALYLSIVSGKDLDLCRTYVKKNIGRNGKFPITDPEVTFLHRESPGNRVKKTTTLLQYLRVVTNRRFIMSPTFTSYTHPDEKESLLAKYVTKELGNRSANKKKMFNYQREGNKVLEAIYKNRQQRNKIKCNSLSGAQGTKSSVLVNKTAHSTLTSICRSASSNTNANTERFLTGNRHYWSVNTAINNIVSIVRQSDYQLIRSAIDYFQLTIPTVEDVLWAVKRCTDLYWRDPNDWERIVVLVSKLTPIQRTAYLYTGDLYNLGRLNRELVRGLFTGLSVLDPSRVSLDPHTAVEALGGDEKALIGIVCQAYLTSYKKGIEDGKLPEDPNYPIIGYKAEEIIHTVKKFGLLIRAFWMTRNIPCSMALFPESIRRSVIASDTDSSIFSTQEWTQWYVGEMAFDQLSFSVSAATTYLCSRLTAHTLCVMSGNMGVAKQHLRMLEMKNEFAFKMFSLTSMGKHYFAAKAAQEGGVFKEYDWEIKGATLKNSKAPKSIMVESDALIEHVAHTVMSGKKIKVLPILQDIANKEHVIRKSILSGSTEYFTTGQIKAAESYKTENSPYLQYDMWKEVFAPKYGECPPPPYGAIKVSIDTDTPAKFSEWVKSFTDTELASRLLVWMELKNKSHLTTIYIPITIAQQIGIPTELIDRMNIRSMVHGIMRSYYLILESLGLYVINDNLTRLVSDDFPDLSA